MKSQSYSSLQYRADIDGLRALAVLSVLIFHLNSDWLPGGYLGVDVFFVISGYLITSIIVKQLDQGSFSFKNFYTRRIKRILPLFFTVLIPTIIVASFLLLPNDYEQFWRSARYAIQFRANRAFMGDNYFDVATEEKPLLHLWSLAIEEQFYFIFPLACWLTYKVFQGKNNKRFYYFLIIIAGIIISTILAEYSFLHRANDSYYMLRNRAAELLIGCGLALFPFQITKKMKSSLGAIGIILLILCLILFDPTTSIPGVYVLLPTIAAALFILDDSQSGYKKLFTIKPIRLIGLWSFSIYLWHWPILAFMRYVQQSSLLPITWIVSAVLMTFFLSILSYYFIENTFRRNKAIFSKSIIYFWLIPALISFILSSFLQLSFIQNRVQPHKEFSINWDDNRLGCDGKMESSCSIGDLNSPIRYLLIGDSHALHLGEMMDIIGQHEKIHITLIAVGGCLIQYTKTLQPRFNDCKTINDYLKHNIQQFDKILISQYYYLYNQRDPNFIDNLKDSTSAISMDKKVSLLLDIPSSGKSIQRTDRFQQLGLILNQEPAINSLRYREILELNKKIEQAMSENDAITTIDLTPYFQLIQKKYTHVDEHHITKETSAELGRLIIDSKQL
ncbi:MAG TPA: acyltransferase [Candidatus Ignatzschineria merdigallinarum]|uniref:Acyltransferase n=1 Tax=Candidatus Ignatzschineria merdigallinarum TaxID=2838621 RepID=A0A9D1TUP4_9GAMM|nr:acyltransferase [Candidatus Ignatzschineria merdigallinarum]